MVAKAVRGEAKAGTAEEADDLHRQADDALGHELLREHGDSGEAKEIR